MFKWNSWLWCQECYTSPALPAWGPGSGLMRWDGSPGRSTARWTSRRGRCRTRPGALRQLILRGNPVGLVLVIRLCIDSLIFSFNPKYMLRNFPVLYCHYSYLGSTNLSMCDALYKSNSQFGTPKIFFRIYKFPFSAPTPSAPIIRQHYSVKYLFSYLLFPISNFSILYFWFYIKFSTKGGWHLGKPS